MGWGRVTAAWGQAQHRNAVWLMLNSATGAVAGVLFWLVLTRVAQVDAGQVGVGYALVALGTIVGLVAKGGLDTALIRHLPNSASGQAGSRLTRLAVAAATGVALASTAILLGLALAGRAASAYLPALDAAGWALVAGIGVLLAISWLQDAWFLAHGTAWPSLKRNLVLCAARVALPVPLVWLAWPHPVALAWGLGVAASVLAAWAWQRSLVSTPTSPQALEPQAAQTPSRRAFLRTAWRNGPASAAEFLPGLLLTPLVLAIDGPAAAGHFAMAWTAASLLFLAAGAMARSALAEMVRDPARRPEALRRAARQMAALLVPGAVAGALLAPAALSIFGPGYAQAGALPMAVLCLSTLAVAPSYLYIAVLRAQERPAALAAFPLAMVALLFTLAPWLDARWGLAGVALAWALANAPFGAWSLWALARLARPEVKPARAVRGRAHVE